MSGVSCLCLTYGRPQLLEEAIESFLRQRWQIRTSSVSNVFTRVFKAETGHKRRHWGQ